MSTLINAPSYELIGKYLANELNPSDRLSVEEWINSTEDNQIEFSKIKQAWQHVESYYTLQDLDVEKAKMITWFKIKHTETNFQEEQEEPEENTKSTFLNYNSQFFRYAAILIILIGLPLAVYFYSTQNKTILFNQIEAPIGSRTSLTLTDGTKVWLNAGSILRFDNNFNNGERNVYLEGEAFFDVTKNKKLPFIVQTSDISLKVLGTAFNIKCYEEEGTIETTLVRGSVMIESKNEEGIKETTMLKPNEKAIFIREKGRILLSHLNKINNNPSTPITSKAEGIKQIKSITDHIIIKPVEVEEDISWKDGYFLVNNESLEALMIKLSRRYDFTFKFLDQNIKDYYYTGKIKESSLEQMLTAIKLTSPIDFEVNQKEVLIKENHLREKDFKVNSK